MCKGNKLQEWYNQHVHSLKRQHETLSMAKEDVGPRETRLAERKACLDAKEAEISSREAALELSLRNKEEELETRLVQHTNELEDGHEAALATLSSTSATQLKKVSNQLAVTAAAKVELEARLSTLMEELARNGEEVEAIKEKVRKAQTTLEDAYLQLSSKSQDLGAANNTIFGLQSRLASLEQKIESAGVREGLFQKDPTNAQALQREAEYKLGHHIEPHDL